MKLVYLQAFFKKIMYIFFHMFSFPMFFKVRFEKSFIYFELRTYFIDKLNYFKGLYPYYNDLWDYYFDNAYADGSDYKYNKVIWQRDKQLIKRVLWEKFVFHILNMVFRPYTWLTTRLFIGNLKSNFVFWKRCLPWTIS
jgi:hypothetical protein